MKSKLISLTIAAGFFIGFVCGWYAHREPKIIFNDGVMRRYVIPRKSLESHNAQTVNWSYPRIDIKFYNDSIHFYTDENTFNRHRAGDTVELLIIRSIIDK